MHLTFRNVNNAFEGLVKLFAFGRLQVDDNAYIKIPTTDRPSRAGDVLVLEQPMLITYTHPKERVLFNRYRNANPFFHLYESLWMLAGHNDVEPLKYFNSQIADIASDDGETFNGAYGYRWRQRTSWNPETAWCLGNTKTDQLEVLINHFKENPDSRRGVLQMWNVEDDLLKIDSSKDVCCNTNVYFSIRHELVIDYDRGGNKFEDVEFSRDYLDMTVCNRSNDLIWGTLGSDYVTFSILQEYMAAMIGVEVGVYNQFTNNLHVYRERFEPEKWLQEYNRTMHSPPEANYDDFKTLVPLVGYPESFDEQCSNVVDYYKWSEMTDPFMVNVAIPSMNCFNAHKNRNYKLALDYCKMIMSDDWRLSCTEWIERRKKNWEKKNASL